MEDQATLSEAASPAPTDEGGKGLGAATCSAVLFLDVDGVLNRCAQSGQGLESDKVALLKVILDATVARVVLSSTWRKKERNLNRVKLMLQEIGHELHGITPVLDSREPCRVLWLAPKRCDEIKIWLSRNPETGRFVIVDDEWDAGDFPGLKENFVQTDSFVGLTPENAARIVDRLNGKVSHDAGPKV